MIENYLKFYENNTRKILEEELDKITTFKYLKNNNDGYIELKNNCFIGKVDKRAPFAFLLNNDDDIYIDRTEAREIMDSDIVLVVVKKGKAYVAEILKRGLTHIIATVYKRRNGFKYYTDKPLGRNVLVNDESKIVDGSIVKLKVETIKHNRIFTNLEQVIGHITDPDIEILKIVATHNWPDPDMVSLEEQAANININIDEEKKHRLNLTDELIVTIDGADAKDLDDAISLKIIDDVYHLGVHIADVSLYVKRNSNIDKEAYKKSTSVYLANKVIPMLPRKLANDYCSLNPNTEKLALSLLMKVNKEGKVLDYELRETIIESKHRLNYDEVNLYLNENKNLETNELNELITNMYNLSKTLKENRTKRGELDFESDELNFTFNDKNEVIDVSIRKTDKGEEIIESLMLLANETVAFHMETSDIPSIYRIHERPETEKLENAIDTLNKLNAKINKKAIHNVKIFQDVLKESKDTKYEDIINMTLLRAMQRAKYDPNPLGHYGLAARHYTHFTSPIRRYSDLLLHRIIKELVLGQNNNLKNYKYYENNLDEFSKHISRQERLAIDIEREVVKLKSCEYLLDKINEEYEGQITQILKTGFFVKLKNGIEGFVNIKNNFHDSIYNEQLLSYKVNGKLYNIGDIVNISVLDVDMLELKIDFKLIRSDNNENNS